MGNKKWIIEKNHLGSVESMVILEDCFEQCFSGCEIGRKLQSFLGFFLNGLNFLNRFERISVFRESDGASVSVFNWNGNIQAFLKLPRKELYESFIEKMMTELTEDRVNLFCESCGEFVVLSISKNEKTTDRQKSEIKNILLHIFKSMAKSDLF